MINKRFNQKGFTLVEVLVSVSIVALISGLLLIGFKNFADFQQYNQAVADVDFVLNQAKLSARSAEGDSSHGVWFDSNSITVFEGDVYDVMDANNQVYNYDLVTFTTTLTGGTDEITFSKLSSLPSATGTILIEGVNYSASTTVTITDSGVIQ